MNNYKKSNYAINKVSKGIVYKNADGSVLEVTFEKILAETPGFTKADFDKLKELSDALYLDQQRGDILYDKYVKASYDEAFNGDWLQTAALEDEIIKRSDESLFAEKMGQAIETLLTPTQKRRFIMACLGGLSAREIARIEGANHKSVLESLTSAKSKIKKFLKKI